MDLEALYRAIFKRKSVRMYDMAPLPQDKLDEIKSFAAKVTPVIPGIKFEFSYLAQEDVKGMFSIKAPHYLCLYSEKKAGYLLNAGFVLQQMDLYLSFNDIGSCWLGMAKPTKGVPEQANGMEFVIMLAFGNAQESVHRKDSSEFKRKKLSEITSIQGAEELLEPVRLAPSATNSQTWFFSGDTEKILVSREKLSLLKGTFMGRLNQIDSGIALCHLWLSLKHTGIDAVFVDERATAPDGYEYMITVKAGKEI